MSVPASPAEMRAFIVERLVGDTGEPDQVAAAARALAERAVPAIEHGLRTGLGVPLAVEVADVELTRLAQARPDAANHAMAIAASASSPDALVLTIDNEAVAVVVNLLFGGDAGEPAAPIARDLSALEVEVATAVFEQVAQAINGSGPRAFEFKLPVPMAMTGAEMHKHMLRDGPAVRVVFSLATAASRGTMALTMPQRVQAGDGRRRAGMAHPFLGRGHALVGDAGGDDAAGAHGARRCRRAGGGTGDRA